jgi:hypothetical protein
LLFGVLPGLLDIYQSESKVMMRESQQNLRMDATQVKSLTDVKKHLKRKIEDQKQWQQRSSPHSGAQMQAEIEQLEAELDRVKLLTVPPSSHVPRGMVARVSLRILGGTAAHHTCHEVCRYPRCFSISRLAALTSEHAPSG